jgi:hypothetical protein
VGLHFFYFYLRKLHPLKRVFCGSRWRSKIPTISGFYKKYMSWFELETYHINLKPFTIILRVVGRVGTSITYAIEEL